MLEIEDLMHLFHAQWKQAIDVEWTQSRNKQFWRVNDEMFLVEEALDLKHFTSALLIIASFGFLLVFHCRGNFFWLLHNITNVCRHL